jgi:hypothetical protein
MKKLRAHAAFLNQIKTLLRGQEQLYGQRKNAR